MSDEKTYEADKQGVYYIVPAAPVTEATSKVKAIAAEPAETETWTIARLWDAYQTANPGLKGMSVYRAIYNAHLSRPFGTREPSEISAFDLDRLKLESMKGKSPKSVANTLELLRRIVNFGVKRGLCDGPGFTIQLPRVSNEKTEDLTREELEHLIAVLDRHLRTKSTHATGAAMMKLALYTGMRRGEMFRLKWSDLDFNRNNILLRDTKGGCNEVIPMSSHARRLLEGLKGHESDAGCQLGGEAGSECRSDYIFPGQGGGKRRDVRRQVNSIKEEAGLPADFRPLHGLRHVFASGLVSSGVEFQIVQRLLTHKGGTVTHRYAHIRDDAMRAAAELAGQLVQQAAESNNP